MENQIRCDDVTKEMMDRIIEEISAYEIDLQEDPTLPHLRQAYLQKIVAQCRAYQNRVQYYMTMIKRHWNGIRRTIKMHELDFEMKLNGLLSDDPIVKKGSSILDRKAIAMSLLKSEVEEINKLKIEENDANEYYLMIKSKYDQLKQSSNDIKMQRTLVRDDQDERGSDGGRYSAPVRNQDKTVPDGLPPLVKPNHIIEPKDLMDPEKRPDDMPEPVNAAHAVAIAEFLSRHPDKSSSGVKPISEVSEIPVFNPLDDSYKSLID